MKLDFSRQIFRKSSSIEINQNPSRGSRVIACGETDRQTDRRTDMTKLIVAFRIFANALKNYIMAFLSLA